jgi:CheY-like chemotaxis protein
MFLIASILKRAGYTVLQAERAEQGVAMARSARPALILMDVALPGLDGHAATRMLKADPETSRIPIIALTAHAMKGDEERAREAGCDGYVTKPLDARVVLKAVADLIALAAGK